MDVNLKDGWSDPKSLGSYGERGDLKPPFKVYILPNLLCDNKVVNQLRDDINSSVKLKPKDNDLYRFKQNVMLDKVRLHMEEITGKKLSTKNFDITASRYDIGDYLLCHNDDIKDNLKKHGRTLAFIYYLNSRPWTREDGGSLILYDSDQHGEPIKINNSILPKPNTLILFDTSSTSWHSVEEVFCKDDFRLSINGWFHTDGPCRLPNDNDRAIELSPYEFHRPITLNERVENFIKDCINEDYLMAKTWVMVQKRFKKKSEINLTNFLKKNKFKEICQALKETAQKEEHLDHVGPYNKRNYKVLKYRNLPPICRDLYDVFISEPFFLLLSQLTGLDLQPPTKKCTNGNESEVVDEETNEDEEDDDEDEESDETGLEDSDEEEEEDEEDEEEDEEGNNQNEDEENNAKSSAEEGEGDLKIAETKSLDDEDGCKPETSKRKLEEPTTSRDILEEIKKAPKKRKRVSDPLARLELRHLQQGSYTLIHDYAFEMGEKSALDVILHFNHDFEVNFDNGGYMSYIDVGPEDDPHDMDCELLTVEPKSNCLSLAYRCDEGTCRFLKHINKSHTSSYQDLYCVYYERPDDLPHYKVIN